MAKHSCERSYPKHLALLAALFLPVGAIALVSDTASAQRQRPAATRIDTPERTDTATVALDVPLANAQDIGARAAQWLEQRERGEFGPSEQVAFEAWLEESLAHRTAYWRVNAAWERANRLSALGTRHDVPPASSKRIGAPFSISGGPRLPLPTNRCTRRPVAQ